MAMSGPDFPNSILLNNLRELLGEKCRNHQFVVCVRGHLGGFTLFNPRFLFPRLAPATVGRFSYGVNTSYGSSDCLVENNIFNSISSPLLIDQGASGNVFGYNYMTNMIYPGFNLAEGCETTHGAHPTMNLFEGNYGTQIGHTTSSTVHPATQLTHFRERMTGLEPGKQNYTYPVSVQGTNWYENYVGCVFGTAGYHRIYEYNITNGAYSYPPVAIFWLGACNLNEPNTNGSITTVQTQFRHGNYDVATTTNSGIVWDPNTPDHTVPASLYLSADQLGLATGLALHGLIRRIPAER